ncbi:hypothetical protein CK203_094320 [Vitis vinifera]|uniref:Transmembrane protein n=1 Tax=Vitis vinifera TaxID=29760 RepID=A0A438D2D6_VITVI|nr:hypothetical protein CK203_094320 [Vitis vinifera]
MATFPDIQKPLFFAFILIWLILMCFGSKAQGGRLPDDEGTHPHPLGSFSVRMFRFPYVHDHSEYSLIPSSIAIDCFILLVETRL